MMSLVVPLRGGGRGICLYIYAYIFVNVQLKTTSMRLIDEMRCLTYYGCSSALKIMIKLKINDERMYLEITADVQFTCIMHNLLSLFCSLVML